MDNVDTIEQNPAPQVIDSDGIIIADLLGAEPDDDEPRRYVDSDVGIDGHGVRIAWKPLASCL